MLQRYYPRKPRGEIAKLFGRGFAEAYAPELARLDAARAGDAPSRSATLF